MSYEEAGSGDPSKTAIEKDLRSYKQKQIAHLKGKPAMLATVLDLLWSAVYYAFKGFHWSIDTICTYIELELLALAHK